MTEVQQACARCDTVTTHRADAAGVPRCVRCTLEKSLPGYDAPTPLASPVTPLPDDKPRRRPAEIIAAIVTVLVVAFLVYAFIKRP